MARNKLAASSERLATVIPKELAETIKGLAAKEERSVSQFLAMYLKKEFNEANKRA